MIFDPLASSSHGNAYVVSDGHTSILLECGIPFRKLQKALGFRMGDIMACFVSHEHKDHAHSIKTYDALCSASQNGRTQER